MPVGQLPRWIAHRGGGALAPENTLAGIRAAARWGLQAVEFDVMLSAAGTPFLIHDETLERTTNGRGRVCETPDDVLAGLDAGEGETLPTLNAALALCAELRLAVNVEIKPAEGYDARTGDVVAASVAQWCRSPSGERPAVVLSSFSEIALKAAQRVAPTLSRALLFERIPDDWLARVAAVGATAVHCAVDGVNGPFLTEAQGHGLAVRCYTVNEYALAERLFSLGVDAVFTDRLDIALC